MSATEPLATLPPLATSVTSPSTQTQGKVVDRRVLHLSDIPGAMDKMGWTVAAKLMRHWFSIRPAWEMSPDFRRGRLNGRSFDPMHLSPSQYNDQIVSWDWMASFQRMKPVVKDLVDHWANEAGVEELMTKLIRSGWNPKDPRPFELGQGLTTARELDSVCQVNFREVGATLDCLDDFYGALGIGTVKLAVTGQVHSDSSTGVRLFYPDRIGLYLRDTYDFNSKAVEKALPLGIWSRERCLSKAEMFSYLFSSMKLIAETYPDFVPVYNHDFRRWQKTHGSGGDFIVYSDVKWMRVQSKPIILR